MSGRSTSTGVVAAVVQVVKVLRGQCRWRKPRYLRPTANAAMFLSHNTIGAECRDKLLRCGLQSSSWECQSCNALCRTARMHTFNQMRTSQVGTFDCMKRLKSPESINKTRHTEIVRGKTEHWKTLFPDGNQARFGQTHP